MSYCVNCGVELAKSEKRCPLCDAEVINPKEPWREPDTRPYPKRVEQILTKINRKYVVLLVSLLMLIPVIISGLADIVYNGHITWSALVTGGVFTVFVLGVFPFLYERPRPYLYFVLDSATLVAYVGMIASLSKDGSWYVPLGLPLVACACVGVSVFTYVLRRSKLSGLKKAAWCFVILALVCVGVELSINLFVGRSPILIWSLFVAASCSVFAAVMLLLNKRDNLREEIIKRLFV